MSEDEKAKKKLEEIKGKKSVGTGSDDQVEDWYPAGLPADIPNGVVICKVHGVAFVDGYCPKCPRVPE
jgi:hypothetical protein